MVNCYNCEQLLNPLTEPTSALIHAHCLNSIFSKRITHLREGKRIIEPRTFLVTIATPQPKAARLDVSDRSIFYRRLDMAARPALHKAEQQAGADWDVQFCLPIYDTTRAITFQVLATRQKGLVKCSTR